MYGNSGHGTLRALVALGVALSVLGGLWLVLQSSESGAVSVLIDGGPYPTGTPTTTASPTPLLGPDSPCSPHNTGPSNIEACNICLCAIDGFCCSTNWDAQCVGEAAVYCGSTCLCTPRTPLPVSQLSGGLQVAPTPPPTITPTPTSSPGPRCGSDVDCLPQQSCLTPTPAAPTTPTATPTAIAGTDCCACLFSCQQGPVSCPPGCTVVPNSNCLPNPTPGFGSACH